MTDGVAASGIDPAQLLAIRHVYGKHDGIRPDSTDDEILTYTARQSCDPRRFPARPQPLWAVFVGEEGNRARLWSIVENHGQETSDGNDRTFRLTLRPEMSDLRDRLVISWPAPRRWVVRGSTSAAYPVLEIADAQPIPFPGFDALILSHFELQAVMRDPHYHSWRTALRSVAGIYLITDTRDGRQYVGKADGAETISQRWAGYAASGHGGNVELRSLDPSTLQFSILRVFDPTTPQRDINSAETHYKRALGTRAHGLNRN